MSFSISDTEEFKNYITTRVEEMDNEQSFIHSKIDLWLTKLESKLSSSNEIKQKKK